MSGGSLSNPSAITTTEGTIRKGMKNKAAAKTNEWRRKVGSRKVPLLRRTIEKRQWGTTPMRSAMLKIVNQQKPTSSPGLQFRGIQKDQKRNSKELKARGGTTGWRIHRKPRKDCQHSGRSKKRSLEIGGRRAGVRGHKGKSYV